MAAAVPTDGTVEAFSGFRLSRASSPTEPVQAVYEPSFCFVAQDNKKALLGGEIFRYDCKVSNRSYDEVKRVLLLNQSDTVTT
jgi:hypothetical protein